MRLTIVAVVLAVLSVTAAVIIVPRSSEGASRSAHRMLIAPGALEVDRVSAITLERRDAAPLRFERRGEAWMQTQPIAHPMDPFSIRQLIVQAIEARVLGEIDASSAGAELDAAALGFDPPVARVTYESADGEVTINLGRLGLGGRAYATIEGDDTVLVVENSLHDRAVAIDPKEWRQRLLFPGVSVDAHRITFTAANVTMELQRDGRQWLMRQPVATRADDIKLEEYIANLAKAQLTGFILDNPESLTNFGLEPGVGVITIDTGSGETATLRLRLGVQIGASTGDRFAYVEGRDTVVRINRATWEAMFPEPATLIDPTGSGVQAADVKTVTVRTDEGELVFQRDLERWRALSHDNREVSAALVEELLRQLTELRAPQVSIETYPTEKQVALVMFAGFGDRPIDTVRIARDDASGNWALENGDNVLRVFPASLKLRLHAEDYGLPALTP